MLLLFGGYAAMVAVVLRVTLSLIGRGIDITPMQAAEVYSSMWFHGLLAALIGVAVLMLRRRTTCGPRWPRLNLLLIALLLCTSLDRIAGVLYPPPLETDSIFVPHASRGWAYRRGVVGRSLVQSVRTNSHGLRGEEFPRSKPAGEFRLLFVGDSVTFGRGGRAEDTFVAQCGELLHENPLGSRIRCINGGVSGYATWQELAYLREEGLGLSPDLVVLDFCFNDVTDLAFVDPDRLSGPGQVFSFSNTPHWSGFVRAARSISNQRLYREAMDSLRWEDMDPVELRENRLALVGDRFRNAPPAAIERAWKRAIGDLEKFDALCRENDLPWVLLALPFDSQFGEEKAATPPQEILQSWAESRQVPYLDLLPVFRRQIEAGTIRDIFLDDLHLTAKGNRVVAEELVLQLKNKGFIP